MFTDEELELVAFEADRFMVLVVQSGRVPQVDPIVWEAEPNKLYPVVTSRPGLVYNTLGPMTLFECERRAKYLRQQLELRAKVLVWPDYRVRWFLAERRREEAST